jgi:4-amino-4-deoxy-L-arabinose transferase-like glycosyltransferase
MQVQTAARHLCEVERQRTRGSLSDHSDCQRAHSLPSYLSLLTALLAALALFRVAALYFNRTDLFTDESQYWFWSLEPAFGYFSKPPLIAWIIAATTPACGDSEFCIRLPAVLIHITTSFVIFALGQRLFSPRAGFWSAITFATLPGISVSSGIISTDVPLLLAWALALLVLCEWLITPSLTMAALLGAAIGVGLNAKYAMAYFIPCAGLFFILVPEMRRSLRWQHLLLVFAVAALIMSPNLIWNAMNSFSTFSHTADNANWKGSLFNPDKAAEFFIAQFGVFGPILFGALVAIAWQSRTCLRRLSWQHKFLLAFSVPIILALTLQGLLSRSHANWAAPAYVAATILVASTLLRDKMDRMLHVSLGLHAAIGVVIAVATWQAGRFKLPLAGDPFARTLGNRDLTAAVLAEWSKAEQKSPYRAILTNDRDIAGALLYYGRDANVPVYAWPSARGPSNHFEQTRAYTAKSGGPVLFVGLRSPKGGIAKHFRTLHDLGMRTVPVGQFGARTVHLADLRDYSGAEK